MPSYFKIYSFFTTIGIVQESILDYSFSLPSCFEILRNRTEEKTRVEINGRAPLSRVSTEHCADCARDVEMLVSLGKEVCYSISTKVPTDADFEDLTNP